MNFLAITSLFCCCFQRSLILFGSKKVRFDPCRKCTKKKTHRWRRQLQKDGKNIIWVHKKTQLANATNIFVLHPKRISDIFVVPFASFWMLIRCIDMRAGKQKKRIVWFFMCPKKCTIRKEQRQLHLMHFYWKWCRRHSKKEKRTREKKTDPKAICSIPLMCICGYRH